MSTPSKPDTAAIRSQASKPIAFDTKSKDNYRLAEVIRDQDSTIFELCNYIDAQKVTVEQIREFVASGAEKNAQRFNALEMTTHDVLCGVLDFIDNGPPKPTAEAVLAKEMGLTNPRSTTDTAIYAGMVRGLKALREAGYLREDV
jgi:hypothetical protein